MTRKFLTLLCVVVLSVGALELFLRTFHTWVLPMSVSNEIATGYHAGWSGIYDWAPDDNMFRMRPDFARDMFFNGYTWHHQTDSRGLRHPRGFDQAPVVLLGDSMIYGHGVEQEDTIRENLEKDLGVPVANLGIQAGSMHQEYQLLRDPGLSLNPRVAVLFFLKNDPYDLTHWLTDGEMLRLVTAPPEPLHVDYFDPRPRSSTEALWEEATGFYTVRAYDTLSFLLRKSWEKSGQAHATRPAELWRDEREPLAMAFHNELLRRTNRLARQNDIVLLYVFIKTGFERKREQMFERILRKVSAEESIPFLSLGPALEAARAAGTRPLLPNDGHFSPEGARIVASTVAAWIEEQDLNVQLR